MIINTHQGPEENRIGISAPGQFQATTRNGYGPTMTGSQPITVSEVTVESLKTPLARAKLMRLKTQICKDSKITRHTPNGNMLSRDIAARAQRFLSELIVFERWSAGNLVGTKVDTLAAKLTGIPDMCDPREYLTTHKLLSAGICNDSDVKAEFAKETNP